MVQPGKVSITVANFIDGAGHCILQGTKHALISTTIRHPTIVIQQTKHLYLYTSAIYTLRENRVTFYENIFYYFVIKTCSVDYS